MKRLTSVTIILMIPTLIASFYGMNVRVPLEDSSHAFYYVMGISICLSLLLLWYLVKKRWF